MLNRDGADIAFDDWTLTRYFASRLCTIRIFLVANFIAKVKSFVASLMPQTLATAVA